MFFMEDWGLTEYKLLNCVLWLCQGCLLDGKSNTMMGCGKGSAPVGEAVREALREVSKLCKGHAALSPPLGLHYSTPIPRPLSEEVSCLPVPTP